jgi:hypothetical protein
LEVIVQDNVSTDGNWELLQQMAEDHPELDIKQNVSNLGMNSNWGSSVESLGEALIVRAGTLV